MATTTTAEPTSTNNMFKQDPLLPTELDNVKSWQSIYPSYIDSTKTVAEGRRIGKSKCVEEPTAREIFAVCRHLKLKSTIELDKRYSRDPWVEGRVKVQLKNDDKNNDNNNHITKRKLLEEIARLIPNIDTRIKKAQDSEQKKQQELRAKEKQEQQVQKKKTSGKRGKK